MGQAVQAFRQFVDEETMVEDDSSRAGKVAGVVPWGPSRMLPKLAT